MLDSERKVTRLLCFSALKSSMHHRLNFTTPFKINYLGVQEIDFFRIPTFKLFGRYTNTLFRPSGNLGSNPSLPVERHLLFVFIVVLSS